MANIANTKKVNRPAEYKPKSIQDTNDKSKITETNEKQNQLNYVCLSNSARHINRRFLFKFNIYFLFLSQMCLIASREQLYFELNVGDGSLNNLFFRYVY